MEEKIKKVMPKKEDARDIAERTLVVDKLPTQQVRVAEENGVRYNLLTVEEASTELLNR